MGELLVSGRVVNKMSRDHKGVFFNPHIYELLEREFSHLKTRR